MMHLQSGRVRFAMWNLNPDYVQQVKEELKGRRAAILARHAQELKALEADLDEVETIDLTRVRGETQNGPREELLPSGQAAGRWNFSPPLCATD